MKNLIFIFFVIPDLTIAQTKTFKATLVDYSKDKIPAYCGYQIARTTLKFELSENVHTLKRGDKILVVLTCPREMGMENYVNNQEYFLTIGKEIKNKESGKIGLKIFYKYENEKFSRFWFGGFKKIQQPLLQ